MQISNGRSNEENKKCISLKVKVSFWGGVLRGCNSIPLPICDGKQTVYNEYSNYVLGQLKLISLLVGIGVSEIRLSFYRQEWSQSRPSHLWFQL